MTYVPKPSASAFAPVPAVVSITGNYTVDDATNNTYGPLLLLWDLTAGSGTVTLPLAATTGGRTIRVLRIDSVLAHTATIARSGADLINGATSTALTAQDQCDTLICDGSTNWYIVATNSTGGGSSPNFADNEDHDADIGAATTTLDHTPSPSGSLMGFADSAKLVENEDFTLAGDVVTYTPVLSTASPGGVQKLRFWYRY